MSTEPAEVTARRALDEEPAQQYIVSPEYLEQLLEKLHARPAVSLAEYRGLLQVLAAAEREVSALKPRLAYLEQALRMCRDCHSVKQVRTIVRTSLAPAKEQP